MTYDVFISYARKDGLEFAERLEHDLSKHGYSLWRDKRNLDVYQDFTAEIEIGIRESRFVVVCVSPSIEQNPYSFVRREISYARSKNKPIIPLVLPNSDLPLDIINLTWIGCFDGPKSAQTLAYEQGFTNLLTRLTRNDEPGSRPTTSSDPYREYVEGLYEGIVNLLDQTMIKLINVRSEATPSAVQGTPKKHNPLAAFKGRYGMKVDAPEAPITSFREAYERYQGRVLLLGEPGAGKSTTLLSFARDAAAARLSDPTQPLPLLARCAMWDSTAQTPILEWVAESADLPTADLAPLIQAGKTILMLDALDELGHERIERKKGPDGQDIEEHYDPRKRFLPLLPAGIPLVLSCRIKDYAELGETLLLNGAVTLQPLADDQIQHYLSDVSLWEVVQSDSALLDIARTPLLLSLIAFAFRDAPDELKPRADLSEVGLRNYIFDRYVRERYEYEQNRNDDSLPFTLEEVQEILGHVAMINASGGWRKERREIFENVVEKIDFAEKLPADSINRFIEFATLLDLLNRTEDKTTRFIHLKLRDAFAYSYSLTRLYEQDLYGKYSWEHSPSPAKALAQVADKPATLALISLVQNRQVDTTMRQIALSALGRIPTIDTQAALATILQDRNDEDIVRRSAAESLGRINAEDAVTVLLSILQDRTDMNDVRGASAMALASTGGQKALSGLLFVLEDKTEDSDYFYAPRSVAAQALGFIGGEQALNALLNRLQDKTDDMFLRSAAAQALGSIGGEQALNALLNRLQDKTDNNLVRTLVAGALGEIGGEQATTSLAFVLQDKADNEQTREAAAEALGSLGGQLAIAALRIVLFDKTEDSSKRGLRSVVAKALAQIDEQEALTSLRLLLDDGDSSIFGLSDIKAIDALGGPRVAEMVLSMFRQKLFDEKISPSSLILVLNRIGGKQATLALINALTDTTRTNNFFNEKECIYDIAAEALKDIGTPAAIAALALWEADQLPKDGNSLEQA